MKTRTLSLFLVFSFLSFVLQLLKPPLYTADPAFHVFRAYQISTGSILPEKRGEDLGGYMPADVQALTNIKAFYNTGIGWNLDFLFSLFEHQKTSGETFSLFTTSAPYSPLLYLPHALGFALGKGIGQNAFVGYYLAVAFSLLAYFSAVALTISLLPRGKLSFALAASCPLALHQAGSITADTMTNIACFLFIGYIFARREENSILTKKHYFLIAVLLCALAYVKPGYGALLLLFFLFPVKLFKTKAHYFLSFFFLTLLGISIGIGWYSLSDMGSSLTFWKSDLSPETQTQFILQNPFRFIQMVLTTLFAQLPAPHGLPEMVWASYYPNSPYHLGVNSFFLWAYLGMVLFVACTEESVRDSHPWKLLGVTIFTLFSTCIALYALLYISWNEVGNTIISGIQGRYLQPLFCLFILVLASLAPLAKLKPLSKPIALIAFSALILFQAHVLSFLWTRPNTLLEAPPTQATLTEEIVVGAQVDSYAFFPEFRLLALEGWAREHRGESMFAGDRVFLVLKGKKGAFQYQLNTVERKDVAAHFKNQDLRDSGFSGAVKLGDIPPGTYQLLIRVVSKNGSGFVQTQKRYTLPS